MMSGSVVEADSVKMLERNLRNQSLEKGADLYLMHLVIC